MTVDQIAAFYNVPKENLGCYERAVFEYNEDVKNAKTQFMAMNKEELIKHKESLEAELQADELALKRLKARVDYQKKYLKLCEEQIEMFGDKTVEA